MSARDSSRLLVFVLVAAALFALAAIGYHRVGRGPSPEDRAREKAGEVRDRVRDMTHGE